MVDKKGLLVQCEDGLHGHDDIPCIDEGHGHPIFPQLCCYDHAKIAWDSHHPQPRFSRPDWQYKSLK